MTSADWAQNVVFFGTLLLVFIGRNWLVTRISRSVNHGFDERLEKLRTQLRQSEEQFKGELRAKEQELSSLREGVLARRRERDVKLDERRLLAVERIWSATSSLAPYSMVASMMTSINVHVAGEHAQKDPKVRQLFQVIAGSAPEIKDFKNPARDERPFVSEAVWAYFQAYSTLILINFSQAKMLEFGLDPGQFLKIESVKAMVKAVLPHQSQFIDKYDVSTLAMLLEELQNNLLVELKKMISGSDEDRDSIDRAHSILKAVDEIRSQDVRAAAEATQAK